MCIAIQHLFFKITIPRSYKMPRVKKGPAANKDKNAVQTNENKEPLEQFSDVTDGETTTASGTETPVTNDLPTEGSGDSTGTDGESDGPVVETPLSGTEASEEATEDKLQVLIVCDNPDNEALVAALTKYASVMDIKVASPLDAQVESQVSFYREMVRTFTQEGEVLAERIQLLKAFFKENADTLFSPAYAHRNVDVIRLSTKESECNNFLIRTFTAFGKYAPATAKKKVDIQLAAQFLPTTKHQEVFKAIFK